MYLRHYLIISDTDILTRLYGINFLLISHIYAFLIGWYTHAIRNNIKLAAVMIADSLYKFVNYSYQPKSWNSAAVYIFSDSMCIPADSLRYVGNIAVEWLILRFVENTVVEWLILRFVGNAVVEWRVLRYVGKFYSMIYPTIAVARATAAPQITSLI